MMFDTYITRRVTEEHRHNVTVTEQRAPTDDSIRLLKEMQEKAKESLIYSGDLPNNLLTAEIYICENFSLLGFEYTVLTNINGKVIRFSQTIGHMEMVRKDLQGMPVKHYIFQEATKQLAEHIAAEMMNSQARNTLGMGF
jgi:hypothetical protein